MIVVFSACVRARAMRVAGRMSMCACMNARLRVRAVMDRVSCGGPLHADVHQSMIPQQQRPSNFDGAICTQASLPQLFQATYIVLVAVGPSESCVEVRGPDVVCEVLGHVALLCDIPQLPTGLHEVVAQALVNTICSQRIGSSSCCPCR